MRHPKSFIKKERLIDGQKGSLYWNAFSCGRLSEQLIPYTESVCGPPKGDQ